MREQKDHDDTNTHTHGGETKRKYGREKVSSSATQKRASKRAVKSGGVKEESPKRLRTF